jgi:glycosyltransferase involved in cell wall biosynthesis
MSAVDKWQGADGVRDEFGIDASATLIGTVANFRPQKGHFTLLEVADLVLRRIPSVRFLFVGRGPLEDAVKKRASQMGLEDAVVFAGFRSDVPRVLAALDVFALSSGWEGLSIALLEAMARGLPAVATRAGGVPEVIEDGRSGLLVPLNDPRAMAEEIVRVIENRSLAEKLGAEARLRARRFDIIDAVRREEAVYAELLA